MNRRDGLADTFLYLFLRLMESVVIVGKFNLSYFQWQHRQAFMLQLIQLRGHFPLWLR